MKLCGSKYSIIGGQIIKMEIQNTEFNGQPPIFYGEF